MHCKTKLQFEKKNVCCESEFEAWCAKSVKSFTDSFRKERLFEAVAAREIQIRTVRWSFFSKVLVFQEVTQEHPRING